MTDTQAERIERWRLGRNVPINVYEGDRPICQCHTSIDAKRIVDAMNRVLTSQEQPAPEANTVEWWKAEAYRLEETIRLLRTEALVQAKPAGDLRELIRSAAQRAYLGANASYAQPGGNARSATAEIEREFTLLLEQELSRVRASDQRGVWISCADRMPEDGLIVFVWDSGWNASYIAQWCGEDGWDPGDHAPPHHNSDVTHWMAFPQSPALQVEPSIWKWPPSQSDAPQPRDVCGAVCHNFKPCGDPEFTHHCSLDHGHEGNHEFPCAKK
jgi:hypothetical protein